MANWASPIWGLQVALAVTYTRIVVDGVARLVVSSGVGAGLLNTRVAEVVVRLEVCVLGQIYRGVEGPERLDSHIQRRAQTSLQSLLSPQARFDNGSPGRNFICGDDRCCRCSCCCGRDTAAMQFQILRFAHWCCN